MMIVFQQPQPTSVTATKAPALTSAKTQPTSSNALLQSRVLSVFPHALMTLNALSRQLIVLDVSEANVSTMKTQPKLRFKLQNSQLHLNHHVEGLARTLMAVIPMDALTAEVEDAVQG